MGNRQSLARTATSNLAPGNTRLPSSQQSSDSASDSSGQIQFEYELRPDDEKKFLGSGAFGAVYCGVERITHAQCAIKEAKVEHPEAIPSLENESRKLSDVDHKNIVQFLGADLSQDGSTLRMFIERVPGQNLSMMVREGGEWGPLKQDERRFATVAVQVMQGLAYLHENDILHRDIKGQNIMVDTEATLPRCKLCDFGMAKHMETVSGLHLGTIAFTAPEVVEGSRHIKSSDIWSVGCTFVEALTGTRPYPELTIEAQLIYRITMSRKPPEVPPEVKKCSGLDVIAAMLDGLRGLIQWRKALTENEAAIEILKIVQMLEKLHEAATAQNALDFKNGVTEILSKPNFTDAKLAKNVPNDVRVRHILLLSDALEKYADSLPVEQICDCVVRLTYTVVCPDDAAMKVTKIVLKLLSDYPDTGARKHCGWIFNRLSFINSSSLMKRMGAIGVIDVIMNATNSTLGNMQKEDWDSYELRGLTLAMNNLTANCPENAEGFLNAGIMDAFCTLLKSDKCPTDSAEEMTGVIRNVYKEERLHDQLLENEYMHVFLDVLEKKLPLDAGATTAPYLGANILVNLLVGATKNNTWVHKSPNVRAADVARRIENALLSWDIETVIPDWTFDSNVLDTGLPCDACRVGQLFAVWSLAHFSHRRDDGLHLRLRNYWETKSAIPRMQKLVESFESSFEPILWQIAQFSKMALENLKS